MANCPKCGHSGAYYGFSIVECTNHECKFFKASPAKNQLARVYWDVNGREGNSKPLALGDAQDRARRGVLLYGPGTHWIKLVSEEEEFDD